MEQSRRSFIHAGLVVAGTAGLTAGSAIAAERKSGSTDVFTPGDEDMSEQSAPATQQYPAGSENILGGATFDPTKWLVVAPRTFEDLKVGDVFRAPSRTMTAAHTSEFQAVSCDTHPRHYNDDYAKAHGMQAALLQPFQLLSLTAPGATLFTHYVGEQIVALSEVTCKFHQASFVGDTMYPALEIAELTPEGDKGLVTMTVLIVNQRGQVVLSGQQKFLLKRSQARS